MVILLVLIVMLLHRSALQWLVSHFRYVCGKKLTFADVKQPRHLVTF
ncbi:hypothetical protein L342_3307 [Escherichia coli CE516]|nr:hypothetical protein [Enterobacter hormaechei]EFK73879.1 hypothetical protein HMPREF9535_02138 [Escherichia coli MS 78-1]ESS91645.1 hypothetical protein L342_3307 [Escherichia coli CE516]MCV5147492.1 hypothetical protein [Escherichia coli]